MQNIALTVKSPDLDAEIDPRFGRADWILFVEPETMEWTAQANPGRNARGGAGIQAAQFLGENEASAVISGDFGPKAHRALEAAGVTMYRSGPPMTAREAVELYNAGTLPARDHLQRTGRGDGRR